jgi:hypothetical protein
LTTPLNIAALRGVDASQTAKVGAFLSLAQQLGGSFATAILLTLVDHRLSLHSEALSAGINLHRLPITDFIAANQDWLNTLSGVVARESAALSFADVSLTVAAVTAAASVLAFLLVPTRVRKNASGEKGTFLARGVPT